MDKGYIENGFIVDVSNARKTSEIIYELSRTLDLPEAQNKQICLKLGQVDLTVTELTSIKALVESMNSEIEFINTNSANTVKAAEELGIKISALENKIPLPEFNSDQEKVNVELERALDKIFGDENNPVQTFSEEKEFKEFKQDISQTDEINKLEDSNTTFNKLSNITEKEVTEIQINNDYQEFEDFNNELENANNINADEIDFSNEEIQKHLHETEKLPTLYIQRTLRSGQSITSEGNIVIIGDVNPGSEIIAKGDITVWGILGGIAHAGSEGNQYARIRALKMNAIQLRIADVFARRPDSANIPYIQKTETFIPEEACIYRKQIIIHNMKTPTNTKEK